MELLFVLAAMLVIVLLSLCFAKGKAVKIIYRKAKKGKPKSDKFKKRKVLVQKEIIEEIKGRSNKPGENVEDQKKRRRRSIPKAIRVEETSAKPKAQAASRSFERSAKKKKLDFEQELRKELGLSGKKGRSLDEDFWKVAKTSKDAAPTIKRRRRLLKKSISKEIEDMFKDDRKLDLDTSSRDLAKGMDTELRRSPRSRVTVLREGKLKVYEVTPVDGAGPKRRRRKRLNVHAVEATRQDVKNPILALPPAKVFEAEFADKPEIDEVFIMTKEGLLLRHFSYSSTSVVDEDILASMLIVVQNFVMSSFQKKQTRLKELRLGDFDLLINQGTYLSAIVVSSSENLKMLEKPLNLMVKEIEDANLEMYKEWDGDTQNFIGIEDCVDKFIYEGY